MYFHYVSSDNNSYVAVRLICDILITLEEMEKRPKKHTYKKPEENKNKHKKTKKKVRPYQNIYYD